VLAHRILLGGACQSSCGADGILCTDRCVSESASGQACVDGTCTATCSGTLTLCPPGGCFDTQTLTSNCGTCGTNCSPSEICINGSCSGNCGMSASYLLCKGAGTNITSDPANCGACGTACSGGTTCANGTCG